MRKVGIGGYHTWHYLLSWYSSPESSQNSEIKVKIPSLFSQKSTILNQKYGAS